MNSLTTHYNARLLFLLVIFLIALILVFNYFTRPAYLAWKEFRTVEEELGRVSSGGVSENNAAAMQSYIQQKTFNGKYEQLQQHLFNSVSSICDSVRITLNDFSPFNDERRDEAVEVLTTKITVAGDFKQILKMVYRIEKTFQGTGISSIAFYIRQDPKTKTRKLDCDIYLQSILKKL